MKKIIIINDYNYVQGGASGVAIETAHIFKKMGFDVTFFCGCGTINTNFPFIQICLNEKDISNGQSIFQNIYNVKALKRLRELIDNENEYFIFVHGWTKVLSSSIFQIGKKKNVKLILTAHEYFSICPNGGLFNYNKLTICHLECKKTSCILTNCDSRNYMVKIMRLLRYFVQSKIVNLRESVDKLICISDFSESILKPFFLKTPIYRINNPIDLPINEKRMCPELSSRYIYIGRLDSEKGVEDLCLVAKKTGIYIDIIGSGANFQQLFDKYNSDNISFKGWLSKENLYDFLKKSRCLILPSLWYEGAPLSVFEAMNYGIPCIVTNTSASIDFVNDSNGFVYKTHDLIDLEENIYKSMNNNEIKEKSICFFQNKNKISTSENYINMIKKMI